MIIDSIYNSLLLKEDKFIDNDNKSTKFYNEYRKYEKLKIILNTMESILFNNNTLNANQKRLHREHKAINALEKIYEENPSKFIIDEAHNYYNSNYNSNIDYLNCLEMNKDHSNNKISLIIPENIEEFDNLIKYISNDLNESDIIEGYTSTSSECSISKHNYSNKGSCSYNCGINSIDKKQDFTSNNIIVNKNNILKNFFDIHYKIKIEIKKYELDNKQLIEKINSYESKNIYINSNKKIDIVKNFYNNKSNKVINSKFSNFSSNINSKSKVNSNVNCSFEDSLVNSFNNKIQLNKNNNFSFSYSKRRKTIHSIKKLPFNTIKSFFEEKYYDNNSKDENYQFINKKRNSIYHIINKTSKSKFIKESSQSSEDENDSEKDNVENKKDVNNLDDINKKNLQARRYTVISSCLFGNL